MKKAFFYIKKIGSYFSEEQLIKFDNRSIIFILICVILFSLAVVFKTNYSSIGKWDSTIKESGEKKSSWILGKPKGIRSDEWLVQTPSMLSQYNNNFTTENPAIGVGKAPLVYNLPVKHYSAIFHPQFWGFFIFDFDRGFSFYWNFKVFGLMVGFFLLLMLLTRSNFWLSVVGSIWILFSSFVQWWFSVITPEIIAAMCFILLSFCYLFFSKKVTNIILAALSLMLFLPNFIFYLYPPFQISLFYLAIFIFIGFSASRFNLIKNSWKIKIPLILITLTFTAFISVCFYQETKDTVALVKNTAYPGMRVSLGGDMGAGKYFSGFFGYYFTEGKFPKNLGNVCEASNFILLFPAILAVTAFAIYKKNKINPILMSLLAYLSFISIWMFLGLSPFVEKITFLKLVPTPRALIGLGVGSLIASIVFLSQKRDFKLKIKFISIIGIAVFLILFFLNKDLMNFLKTGRLIWIALIFTAIIFWLINKNKILFGIAILLITIVPNYSVNPVSFGTEPITGKELYSFFEKMKREDPEAKWVAFEDRKIADFGKAAGLQFVNGVKYVPDLKFLDSLNENRENRNIYNRFAHVKFDPSKNKEAFFSLDQQDVFTVEIDPCSEKLTGIKYFIFKDLSENIHPCLAPFKEVGKIKVYRMD